MKTREYSFFNTEDFLLDDDFLKWVLHPNQDSDLFWTDFQEKHPEKKKSISEAVFIIRSIQPVEPIISDDRLTLLQKKIGNKPSPGRIGFTLMKYAAILIILAGIGFLVYNSVNKHKPLPFETAANEMNEKGRLILADGTVMEFDSDVASIHQTSSGKLTLNSDTITEDLSNMESDEVKMNQVIIPYGKRSEITLADGTRIWLNSGSQLFYPAAFKGNSREIFLSGEAFFEVAPDKDKPFTVITDDMKMKVLGTQFNVCTYANDPTTQVVLVQGKITAGRNKTFSKSMELEPGDRITYDKSAETFAKDKVDVELYSSWVNGYLVFRNEPVSGIFRKLERYYNLPIVVEQGIDNSTFSGKLDLMEDIEVVLENISFTSSFAVTRETDRYIIKIQGL